MHILRQDRSLEENHIDGELIFTERFAIFQAQLNSQAVGS